MRGFTSTTLVEMMDFQRPEHQWFLYIRNTLYRHINRWQKWKVLFTPREI